MHGLLLTLTTSTWLFAFSHAIVPVGTGGPSLIYEGKDALLTCVVSENIANNTVIWKKGITVLTAGKVRVTSDQRVRVLHDENPKGGKLESGGEVWVLLIKNLKESDSGSYVCEINSEPVLRSIHILKVKGLPSKVSNGTSSYSEAAAAAAEDGNAGGTADATDPSDVFLVPPPLENGENRSYWKPSTVQPQITHDFTECCENSNVTDKCMGFCNVHNILDGTTGIEPEACEKDFPNIVRCMADGRNHVPCCVEKQIPDLCQDMCRGEYTPFTDLLKTRVSCIHHTLHGLQCILKGVQLIPSMPQYFNVDNVTETSVTVSWLPPEKLPNQVRNYKVNLTALHSFDEDVDGIIDTTDTGTDSDMSRIPRVKPKAKINEVTIKTVASNVTSIILDGLRPYTMYGVEVIAVNDYGTSLPSERLRIFTHKSTATTEQESGIESKMNPPNLPDIRGCCEANGLTHRMCLDKMCDPQKTDLATLPDFMVCAPWSNITFTCLANNVDHTPCCRSRGIPSVCFPLCSGKLTTLDFSLFRCLRFMSEYSSCLFQGYGVLAGPPTKLHAVAKTDSFIILDWNKPKRLTETVTSYHVKFRRLGVGDDYLTVEKKNPPLILEGLVPDVYYEFYVVSINTFGKSEPSPRLITRTQASEIVEPPVSKYNMTTCCIASGLLPQCTPLCSYNLRLSDIEKLGPACRAQMSVIMRCAAGGRDHTPCCNRRGVIPSCMSLCRGVMPVTPLTTSATVTSATSTSSSSSSTSSTASTISNTDCLSYAGNILQCFEEGNELIPGPPEDVHAVKITNSSISLSWSQPEVEDNNNTKAVVNGTQTTILPSSSDSLSSLDAEGSPKTVDLKDSGAPSSEATETQILEETLLANRKNLNPLPNPESTTSAPVATATALMQPADEIDFIVQYGRVNNMTMYETVARLEHELTTNQTSIDLNDLVPNNLYRIMVMTRGKYGTSLPSSMILINTTYPVGTENQNQNANEHPKDNEAFGAPSPPHSLAIVSHSATSMQLTWQPPEYSHPHEKITYRVYHKPMKADKFTEIETKLAWLRMENLKPSSQHILYVEALGEKATSLPSETLVAWTDPALPAFVDPPTVHPADNIPEGGSMTILCLAFGNPAPTISLYVGGKLVRQDTSRHMVTIMYNVTADMEHVSCYADNGYGVPMQATRRVNICYPPKIQAAGITFASIGDEVELRCTVDAKPKPKTFFWRDHDGRVPVIQGGNYEISERPDKTRPTVYIMSLKINKLQPSDIGDYFCHAENPFGSSTIPVSVRIRNTPGLNRNVSECCATQNVTMACRSACTYYVDFDAIADRPECIADYDKLMKCAADGSDHRSCCADADVPRKCLNWCRGEAVRSKEICSLLFARTIVGCFEKNRERLPGPPENIEVQVVSDNAVVVKWDPPSKNPNTVDGYRILYHETAFLQNESGENASLMNNFTEVQRVDIKDTTITLEGLKKDVLYELFVKAGNSFGASIVSDPIKFTPGAHHVTSATTTYTNAVGTISGIVASILAILLAVFAVLFYRRHRANGKTGGNGVAFENPTYTRGLEQVQLPTVTSAITSTFNSNGATTTTTSRDAPMQRRHLDGSAGTPATATRSATTTTSNNRISSTAGAPASTTSTRNNTNYTPQSHEVKPTIYEELKLGQEGAGFKKLVP